MMETKLMEKPRPSALETDDGGVLHLFDQVITKNYLESLPDAEVEASAAGYGSALAGVRVDKITKIVYDKDEDSLSKLNAVFAALYSAQSSAFILLRNTGKTTEFYIGINSSNPSGAISVFERAMAGNFPGCVKSDLYAEEVGKLSDFIRDERHHAVGVVTGVPSLKQEDHAEFTQGLEKIIEALGNREYVALLLATPVSRTDIENIAAGYASIYSGLSLCDVQNISLSEQTGKTLGKTLTKGFSRALSKSLAQTTTVTDGTSSSTTTTHTTSHSSSKTKGRSMGGGPLGTALVAGIGFMCGGPVGAAIGASLGGTIGGSFSVNSSRTESDSVSDSTGTTEGTSHSESTGTTTTHGTTDTKSESEALSESDTLSKGISYQYGLRNRGVEEALQVIDAQLERLKDAKNYGGWNWAAYFIAPLTDTVQIGTHIFSGILRGENSGVERNAVAFWGKKDGQYADIISSLARFQHPVFRLGGGMRVMPTAMIGTSELAVGMAFPQKSLPGVKVFESVEFGRSVTTYDQKLCDPLEIGKVFHLGAVDNCTDVSLDAASFSSHIFVTGSTGSGKSNFLYSLLSGLRMDHGADGKGVKFLVIEPAKGEYKDVFGGVRGVSVYGTNPYQTELLRVNPFAFPDKIHVMEHIDRLIEILNAAWPMYAAMPAILKDAVEQTYKNLGWDLIRSTCSHEKPVYPDFHDLLKVLPEVINASAYDQEVKSNYTGSLLTRVKSLTNGYYRTIFQKDELPPADLFDKSCIVDISRVGSTETKSLLMGILFLKLQEYRMANPPERNSGLRHITVFEEAHNLLRKTSTEQGMESANLAGKSVEMLTNAIAEMRTYGEGFVIADQAPGLLDLAVIRNTNTKVVFRLPDYDDRLLVGKAENLSDEQINELARLPTGCAAVYQNNWQEAVLCQTKKYDEKLSKPLDTSKLGGISIDSRTQADGVRIKVLIARASKKIDFRETLRKLTNGERIKATLSLYFPDDVFFSNDDLPDGVVLDEVYRTLVKPAVSETAPVKDRRTWTSLVLKRIFDNEAVRLLEDSEKDNLVGVVFRSLSRYDNDPEQAKGWIEQSKCIEDWRVWK